MVRHSQRHPKRHPKHNHLRRLIGQQVAQVLSLQQGRKVYFIIQQSKNTYEIILCPIYKCPYLIIWHLERTKSTTRKADETTTTLPPNIAKLDMSLDPTKEYDRVQATREEIKNYEANFGSLDYEKSFSALFELLWYAQMPCFDVKGRYAGLNMSVLILNGFKL